jgi:hypothetical protein
MSDHVAKRDFAALHIALARRALGQPVEVPEVDGPVPLFDDDQALADAVDRHPSNGPEEAA